MPIATFLAGAGAARLGWLIRQRSMWLSRTLMGVGTFAALEIAPSLLLDTVVVAADHFRIRTGDIGLATSYAVKYDDVNALRITSEVSTGRRGKRTTNYFLICERKASEPVKIPMNGKLTEAAVIPILTQVGGHNILINNETEPQPATP